MQCPRCGLDNPDDSRFCRHCGTALTGQTHGTAGALAGGSPAPGTEIMLWEGRPSLRTALPQLLLFALIYGAVAWLVYFFSQRYRAEAPDFWRIASPVILIVFGVIFLGILVRHFLRLRSVSYRVTTERLFLEHGLFSKRIDEVELEHYKDIVVHRGFVDRMVGCGDIEIMTTDPSHHDVKIVDVVDPIGVKEIIRSAVEARKKSLGIVRREEL